MGSAVGAVQALPFLRLPEDPAADASGLWLGALLPCWVVSAPRFATHGIESPHAGPGRRGVPASSLSFPLAGLGGGGVRGRPPTPLHCHRSQFLRAAGAGGLTAAARWAPLLCSLSGAQGSVRGRHREQNSLSKVADAPVECLSVV